jgi:SAM-dependent methyltransferase
VRVARNNIIDDCLSSAAVFGDRLRSLGIGFEFDADRLRSQPPPFQKISFRLLSGDPTAAVDAAIAAGYLTPVTLDSAGWAALRRAGGEVLLTHTDQATTRLALKWTPPMTIPRRLRPRMTDVARAHWPVPFWPMALGIRPFSDLLRKLGRRPRHSMGEWLGTPRSLLEPLYRVVSLSSDDVLVDIGCGDGRVLVEAARTYRCRCIGIERDAHLCTLAQAAIREHGLGTRVSIHHGDAADMDYSGASVVFLFMPTHLIDPILSKLLTILQPGARIVAHEQSPYEGSVMPTTRVPLVGTRAVTVAHLWHVGGGAH